MVSYLEQEDGVLVLDHFVRQFWLGWREWVECHEELSVVVLQPGLQSIHPIGQANVVADFTGLVGLH